MSKKKVRLIPTSNRVIVKQHKQGDITAAGIIIPDNAKEKLLKGVIIEVGPGDVDNPITMQVGEEVMFGQYAGTDITLNGENYLLMRENDIFGRVVYVNHKKN